LPATVPVYYVRGLIHAAQQGGLATSALLVAADLSDDAALPGLRHVRVQQFSKLYAEVARLLDDEMLGLQAIPVHTGFTEVLCRACLGTETLLNALEVFGRVFHVGHSALPVSVSSEQGQAVLRFGPAAPGALRGDAVFASQLLVITSYAVLCWLTRQRLPVLALGLPYAAPEHDAAELDRVFACPIAYGQADTTLRFSAAATGARILRNSVDVPHFLARAPGSFIETLLQRSRISARTRDLLHDSLPDLLTLNEVAQRLALSPRTLHRRLELEGETFQSLKDGLRRDLAVYALTRTGAPLKQIAADLGFADQAAFQRAFVQWTGLTPGAYRRAGTRPITGA
jgi:AraC-like DNA-binding protein